jgi:hypothetical protein
MAAGGGGPAPNRVCELAKIDISRRPPTSSSRCGLGAERYLPRRRIGLGRASNQFINDLRQAREAWGCRHVGRNALGCRRMLAKTVFLAPQAN